MVDLLILCSIFSLSISLMCFSVDFSVDNVFQQYIDRQEPFIIRLQDQLDKVMSWNTAKWKDNSYLMQQVNAEEDIQIEYHEMGRKVYDSHISTFDNIWDCNRL